LLDTLERAELSALKRAENELNFEAGFKRHGIPTPRTGARERG
jgi:hypothetical protein